MRNVGSGFGRILSLGALRICGVLLAFIQSIVVARVFGAEVFGIYSFAIAIISVVALFFSFGLDEFLMREIAARGVAHARNDVKLQGAIKFSLQVIIPVTIGVTAFGLVFFAMAGLGGVYRWALAGVTLSYSLLILRKFSEAFAVASKRQAISFLGSKILFPACMIFICSALGAVFPDSNIYMIVLAYVASLFFSTGLAVILVWKQASGIMRFTYRAYEVDSREILTSSMLLALVMSANLIINNMDTVLIGFIASPEEAAFSRVGQKLSDAVGLIMMVAMIHYRPLLAEAHGSGSRRVLEEHVKSLSVVLAIFGLASFIVIQIFAFDIVKVFGIEYFGGVPALRAYTVGSLAMMLSGPGTLLLMMTGQEKAASRILWCVLALNFSLDIAMIPFLGALGAGMATGICQVILAIFTAGACVKRLGINPSVFSRLLS